MIKLIPTYLNELQTFDEKTWKSFEEQFPEQMKFWKENKDKLEQFKKALENMTEEEKAKFEELGEKMKSMKPEDLPKDKEAFEKFLNMGLDKLLPAEALQ
ncbi:hypothetical protein OESDEN_22086 [Oesophagostomum dentatum]|uniref:Uncharacterized protein n=1 Tax=Oesophagostomum dentatum TaxID=61180 RepID=A0A0B1S025_OESDE|nr:hypothetical protein OESDEN_22086 [Oesophagostomum dentatum]